MLNDALNIAIVFSLPAMVGLIILSEYIIISFFQYGSFSSDDSLMSAMSLVAYSIGLPAFILMKVLLTGFFSREDTSTPVKYGVIGVLFNIAMNSLVVVIYLRNPFIGAHAFLALATSLSAWIQVILLYNNLRRNNLIEDGIFVNSSTFKSIISCFIMVLALTYFLNDVTLWHQASYYMRGLKIILYISLGGLLYSSVMYLLGYRVKKIYE
tara:strand:- start:251 stop:883 length:633 start_codon:yes stop_codon:yes gene_type:complete